MMLQFGQCKIFFFHEDTGLCGATLVFTVLYSLTICVLKGDTVLAMNPCYIFICGIKERQ